MNGKRVQNRTSKFLYNTFFAASYQIVVLIAGFITPRFMLQYYGSEINGLITSISQFISYFNLVEAGLSGAAVYALYKPLAENNHREISAIVVATQKFYTISGYIFLLLMTALAILYPLKVKVTNLDDIQVFLLILILGLAGVLEFFTLGKYRAILTADQRLYIISFSSMLYVILNTVIIAVMASMQMNIIIVKTVAFTSILLRCFILYTYSNKNYSYLDYSEYPNNLALSKRWDALYTQIFGTIQSGAPIIISTIFLGLKSVSIYSIYNMIIGGIAGVLGVFTNGLSASFGDIIARGEKEILQKSYCEFEFAYYSLIAVIYSVSFVLIMPFIQLYTADITDANYYNPLLGMLFVLNALLYNLKTPQGMLIISAGHYKETRLQVTIQGSIAALSGMVFALRLGLSGVLLGLILSNLYRDIALLFYIPSKITDLRVFITIKKIICMGVEIGVIILPFKYIHINCNSYYEWIRYGILVTAYASIIVMVIGGINNKKEMQGIWERIKTMTEKKCGII